MNWPIEVSVVNIHLISGPEFAEAEWISGWIASKFFK